MSDTPSDTQTVVGNGLKLVGEAVVPGASEMLAGNIGSGLLHTAIALGAGALLATHAPVLAGLAVLAVKANSYSRSVTGENLFSVAERTTAEGGARRATSRTTAP
jgi:hypothetical protein